MYVMMYFILFIIKKIIKILVNIKFWLRFRVMKFLYIDGIVKYYINFVK